MHDLGEAAAHIAALLDFPEAEAAKNQSDEKPAQKKKVELNSNKG
jgi:hypothetical protein